MLDARQLDDVAETVKPWVGIWVRELCEYEVGVKSEGSAPLGKFGYRWQGVSALGARDVAPSALATDDCVSSALVRALASKRPNVTYGPSDSTAIGIHALLPRLLTLPTVTWMPSSIGLASNDMY